MKRALMLLVLVACSKTADKEAPPAPSASVEAKSAAPSASVAASGSAAPASPAKGAAASYAGTYTLEPAKYYIPDSSGWNGVKQVKDEPAKATGEGAFTLSVDPGGKVTGEIASGPASPAVIDGQMVGDEIRGNVRRKTLTDDGLTGTIVATPAGEGKMALADATSALVREAKLTLKKN